MSLIPVSTTSAPLLSTLSDWRIVARITALALWGFWIISMLGGLIASNGLPLDLGGHVLGADFLQFYSAGFSLLEGNESHLYDRTFQHLQQAQVVGYPLHGMFNFNATPWLALVYLPLALLPYGVAFLVWTLTQLCLLWLSLKLLGCRSSWYPYLLSFFPIFTSFSFGQNSMMLLVCMVGALWCLNKGAIRWAGVCVGLLSFKPQYMIVFLMWFIVDRRYRDALTGFCIIGCLLTLLCLVTTPHALYSFLSQIPGELATIESVSGFPLAAFHTVRSFFSVLIPWPYLACAATAIIIAWTFARTIQCLVSAHLSTEMKASAVVITTLLVSPYNMVYDLSILTIPALLIANEQSSTSNGTRWRPTFAIAWCAILLGVTLVNPLQQRFFTHWLHVSEAAVVATGLFILGSLAASNKRHSSGL